METKSPDRGYKTKQNLKRKRSHNLGPDWINIQCVTGNLANQNSVSEQLVGSSMMRLSGARCDHWSFTSSVFFFDDTMSTVSEAALLLF